MQETSLLVWVPLRPGSHWRAEGIAQTIEYILSEIKDMNVTIVANKEHATVLNEVFAEQKNIEIIPLSLSWLAFKRKNKRKYKNKSKQYSIANIKSMREKTTSSLIQTAFHKVSRIFSKLKYIWSLLGYALKLRLFTSLQKQGFFKKQNQKIWLPVPILPWIGQLKGNTILSFWDPFGFEYREFEKTTLYLLKNFSNVINSANQIVTQSYNNKEYLVNVFGVATEKVNVVFLGSPDYSKYLFTSQSKIELINRWEVPHIATNSIEAFWNQYHKEFINHSILFRLQKRLTAKSKIIMISTQYRPYKGFETLFKIIDTIIKTHSSDIYFIFTALLPKNLKKQYGHIHENLIEINRVSNKQHALLYQLADLTLHPSYNEGGLGTYPQFESASVGTPCLINRGRHTDEMIKTWDKELEMIVHDFTDITTTANAIVSLLHNKELANKNIAVIMKNYRDWSDVSKEYRNLFTYTGSQNVG